MPAQPDAGRLARQQRIIAADETLTVDMRPAADVMLASLSAGGLAFADECAQNQVHGNVEARERMIAQSAVADAHAGLVTGADHAAELLMGVFHAVR